MANVELSGSKLAYVNFEDSALENVNFNGADLTEANFKNAIFKNTSFANTNLTQANFTNTKFTEVDFLGADLTSSKFGNAIFNDRKKNYIWLFAEAKLANVNFCLGFDTEKRDTIEKCASGLICNDFRISKLFNTTKLPEELGACNFKVHQDPSDLMFKEAIKSGNLASIPNAIAGRIIYKRVPSSI